MTEPTTASTKTKTAKPEASLFGLLNYKVPNFDLPKMEVPEVFREMAEKGVAQARDNCERAKAATEKTTDRLRDTFTTAAQGATDYNLKLIEIARANTNTAFACADELFGVKSPAEFIERSTAHARNLLETMTAQAKELAELAQKMTTETSIQSWPNAEAKEFSKVT